MENYIPFEKLSKKAKAERNKQKRHGWGSISPITRKSENKKLYNRKRTERQDSKSYETSGLFCFLKNV